jgi:signal transduction histidine kinase
MLEGFDKEWVFAGTRRYASYTNLKGGEYTFRVKGSNKDGVWNEAGTSVQIMVIPPIWERWWFISSTALLIAVAVTGGYFMRIRRIRLEKRILEEQVRERTQEIERRQLVAEGLREILAILNSNRSLGESLERIIQQAVRLTGARALVIFRSGEDSLPVAVASNLPEGQLPTDSTAGSNGANQAAYRAGVMFMPEWIYRVLAKGEALMIPDLQEYCRTHGELEQHYLLAFGALLAVPLLMNDVVDGGLVLVYDRPYSMNDDELHTAQSFADHAALAIANARLRVQAEEQAVSTERSRLARDLHDAVTQTLFATNLIAEVLPRLWDRSPEIGKQKIEEIRELTRGALAEMRTLLMELRPAALEDVALADLLQQLSEAFTGQARVPVTFEFDRAVQLPPNVKIGFYRIAQEALNNVTKHARASHVKVQLLQGQDGVSLEIADDGIGFDPRSSSPDHFGLSIMEERAQAIGGCLEIESKPGGGTKVRICWDITNLG